MVDYYNSCVNFDKINPLIRSAYNTTSDFEDYKKKLLQKFDYNKQDENLSFLDTIEDVRLEQRTRLAQVEHDYYNQKTAPSFDVPFYAEETDKKQEIRVTSKPPIPVALRRSPSPVFVTEERVEHHIYDRPVSANIFQRHIDDTSFYPHRPSIDSKNTLDNSETSYIQDHIQSMWNEYEIDDYIEKRK